MSQPATSLDGEIANGGAVAVSIPEHIKGMQSDKGRGVYVTADELPTDDEPDDGPRVTLQRHLEPQRDSFDRCLDNARSFKTDEAARATGACVSLCCETSDLVCFCGCSPRGLKCAKRTILSFLLLSIIVLIVAFGVVNRVAPRSD